MLSLWDENQYDTVPSYRYMSMGMSVYYSEDCVVDPQNPELFGTWVLLVLVIKIIIKVKLYCTLCYLLYILNAAGNGLEKSNPTA